MANESKKNLMFLPLAVNFCFGLGLSEFHFLHRPGSREAFQEYFIDPFFSSPARDPETLWQQPAGSPEVRVRREAPVVPERIRGEGDVEEGVEESVVPEPEPDYFGFIGPFEGGHRSFAYDPLPDDGRAEQTVGVGHLMERADSQETFQRAFGDTVNWNDVYHERVGLIEAQGRQLFDHDLQTYVNRARGRIDNFEELPSDVREGIVNAFYRGDIGPQTIELMNAGRWNEVADEYLDHDGYRTAEARGVRGIIPRMDANAQRFRDYAEGLEEGR